MTRNIPCLAVALACAGCAMVYKADNSGPAARIRFVSHSPFQTVLASLADERCSVSGGAGRIALLGGPIAHNNQSIGMIGAEGLSVQYAHEMQIPAGKPFVYVFRTTNIGTAFKCDAAVAFTPLTGQQYETRFIVEELTCKTTLTRLVQSVGAVERVKEEPTRPACSYPGNF